MKTKLLKSMLALLLINCFGCSKKNQTSQEEIKGEGVMTFKEYLNSEIGKEIVVEGYVQAKTILEEGSTSFYMQDEKGGYFISNLTCDQQIYDLLEEGQKVKVTGVKEVIGKENEITYGAIELLEGNKIYQPLDISDRFGDSNLITLQNQKVKLTDMTVVEYGLFGDVFNYEWDNSGSEGSDLYFMLMKDDVCYECIVNSKLSDVNSDVYNAVKELQLDDIVDVEGYLNWGEYGILPYITEISIKS